MSGASVCERAAAPRRSSGPHFARIDDCTTMEHHCCPASGMWQECGLVLCWCLILRGGLQVSVHRSLHVDRLVRSDPVEDVAVGLDLGCEGRPVADVDAVEVLVFQRPERALPDPILAG